MSNELNTNKMPLKAVVLAAGKDATTAGGQSLVPKKLGDHTVLQCVVQNALQVAGKRDFTNEYVDAVEALIDLDKIREAGLKVIVDPMYGWANSL